MKHSSLYAIACFLVISLLDFPKGFAQSVLCEEKPEWEENFSEGGAPSALWIHSNLDKARRAEDNRYDIFQKNGKLNIKFIGKTSENEYLAMMFTSKKIAMRYGKIAVRAKVPAVKGIWPGIWLRETRGINSKVRGEVDLMEWISCFNRNKFQANFHLWGEFNGKVNNHVQYPKWFEKKSFDVAKYHIYSAEWDKEKLIIRIDDELVGIWYAKDYVTWPFDTTYELCLDLGYGGWGASCGYDRSLLPQAMKVDWVKYYKALP